jgi:DNA-binding NarL/FixJ family response regulator
MNNQKKQTILVVDDDPLILDVLKKYFSACDYRVITAENGNQAIAHIQSGLPNVIITDLFMPEVDGFELLRYAQETAPELPVVVITGAGSKEDIAQALLLGAWDFMRKPFEDFSFLQLKIEKVLKESRLIEEKKNYCDHLEALLEQKNVDLSNQEQALTEKTLHLEQASRAIKTLLDQREIEKRSIEQSMVVNLKRFVFPYLNDLETQPIRKDAKTCIDIIRRNIQQLISPVSKHLIGAYHELTPMEAKVADLIRHGCATKRIAETLNISTSTVEKHRNKIRQKLNLSNKKVNLYSYLNSLR